MSIFLTFDEGDNAIIPGFKKCTKCLVRKSNDEFARDPRCAGGRKSRCKQCLNLSRRLWRYNITEEEYDKMLFEQDFTCAICGQKEINENNLSIDHNHKCCSGIGSCGKCVRGFLCKRCNFVLGEVRDDSRLLHSMANYLERYN